MIDILDEYMIESSEYAEWPEKGSVVDGRRITLMTKKRSYAVNQKVHIKHVLEATLPGYEVYIMGPKEIFDEYINDQLQGETAKLKNQNQDPFIPISYDGRVVESPVIDTNYQITSYTFKKPGLYEICWKPGKWKSNVLKIEIK